MTTRTGDGLFGLLMTITTATGSISLHAPSEDQRLTTLDSTYYIDGVTGEFARVRGGSGHFSFDSALGSGNLDGTIVYA